MYQTYEEIDEAFNSGRISKSGRVQAKRRLKKRLSKLHSKGRSSYRAGIVRARKLGRLPIWVDRTSLREIYRNCPEGMTVDHVIPLNGEVISGFHIPENLQYLGKKENRRKGNKFEPLIISASKVSVWQRVRCLIGI